MVRRGIYWLIFAVMAAFVIANTPSYVWNEPFNATVFNFSNVAERNQAGNISTSTALFNFTIIDTVDPAMNISGIYNNDSINVTFFDLQSNVTGGVFNGSRNQSDNFTLRMNVNITCVNSTGPTINATRVDCSFTSLTLPEGNVTLNLTYSDAGGNTNSSEISFMVDLTPPRIGGGIDPAHDIFTPPLNIHVMNDTYLGGGDDTVMIALNVSDNVTSVANVTVDGVLLNRTYYNHVTSYLPGTEVWNGTLYLGNVSSTEGSYLLTITVTDAVGNQNITNISYFVDRTNPVLQSWALNNTQVISNSAGTVYFNYTVNETNLSYSKIEIDGGRQSQTNNSNSSGREIVQFSDTVTPGFHRIKLTLVDNASNTVFVYRNFTMMSKITGFDAEDLFNQSTDADNFRAILFNASIANDTGVQLDQVSNVTTTESFFPNTTFGLRFVAKNRTDVNATALLFFDGSNLDWNATKDIRVQYNETSNASLTMTHKHGAIINSSGQRNLYVVTTENFTEIFGGNTFNINGTAQWQIVWFPNANMSLSTTEVYRNHTVLYAEDDAAGNVRVLPVCSSLSNNIPTTTPSRDNACYVQGYANWSKNLDLGNDNGTMVFIPHYSSVLISDVSAAPIINVTQPADHLGKINDSFFTLKGEVHDLNLNTSSCTYSFNKNGTVAFTNKSFTPTQAFLGSTNYTFSVSDSAFSDLRNNTDNNVTVTCASDQNDNGIFSNSTTHVVQFTVDDTTPPAVHPASISVTYESAEISITLSEKGNLTLFVGPDQNNIPLNLTNTTFENPISFGLLGLTESTNYLYNLTICDRANNCNLSGPYTFTTNAAPSGGGTGTGGGSSGGGSGGSPNTKKSESASTRFDIVRAGDTKVFSISKALIPITEISFKTKEQLRNVDLDVISWSSKPGSILSPNFVVYKYLEIKAPDLKESVLAEANVEFEVSNSWLNDNGFTSDDVALARYKNDRWKRLTTIKIGADSYRSTTPGFSYFAILGGRPSLDSGGDDLVKEEKPDDKKSMEPVVKKSEEKETSKKPQLKESFKLWIALVIFLVLAVVGYFVFRILS